MASEKKINVGGDFAQQTTTIRRWIPPNLLIPRWNMRIIRTNSRFPWIRFIRLINFTPDSNQFSFYRIKAEVSILDCQRLAMVDFGLDSADHHF